MSDLSITHPILLGLLLLAPVSYLAWRRWPPPLSSGHSRAAVALRMVLVVLLALALAGVHLVKQPERRAVVAVVDLSDSTQRAVEDAAAAVSVLAESTPDNDLFGIVTFGRNAQVELTPTTSPRFDRFQTRPDPGYSDLGAALELAANLIPEGVGRQVVLVSDGRQNLGDAEAAVDSLRDRQVRVDVVAVGPPAGAEVTVLEVQAPSLLRAQQSLTVTVRLRSTVPATAGLALQLDGREVQRRDLQLPAGASDQAFELGVLEPGVHRIRAEVDATPDGYPQNNVAEAVVRVVGRPSVLVLEGAPGGGANAAAALRSAGLDPEVRPVEQAPTDAAALVRYDSIVVADAPAEAFPPDAMEAIARSVKDMGRGLVSLGGATSYGPGGWQGTPLETALPVKMEVPVRQQKPDNAVVLVAETMEAAEYDAILLGATKSVIDQLTPTDELAVVALQSEISELAVPLTPVTDREGLFRQVQKTVLGDPRGGYANGLQLGLDTVETSGAATKHVVLLGDGDAVENAAETRALMAGAAARGIFVTVVGVDVHLSEPFMEYMKSLALTGGSPYFVSRSPLDVPEVLLRASRSIVRPAFEQEPFFPSVTSAGDLLAGVALDAFPELTGYVVTSAKGEADVVLTSPKQDPVLAGWQYGLGRSVAWTSDTRGRWTGALLASPVGGALIARMVAWTLPPPVGELNLEAVPGGDGLQLTATAPGPGGEIDVEVSGPGQRQASERLRGVGQGRWEGQVRADLLGTYVLHAALRRGGAVVAQAELIVAVPYSPEYREEGRDDALLGRLAARTGAVLTEPERAWTQRLPDLAVAEDIFWILLLLAALIWPVDVAVRRLNLTPRQALALLGRGFTSRGGKAVEVSVAPAVSTLRQRMQERREAEAATAAAQAEQSEEGR